MLIDLRDSKAEALFFPLETDTVVMVIAADRGEKTEKSATFLLTEKQLGEMFERRADHDTGNL